MNQQKKLWMNIAAGVLLFVLALLLPGSLFSYEARLAVGTIALMVFWWVTRPVHIAVTALLPIVVNALFRMAPMADVLKDYFSEIAVLLIGAHIIIACFIGSGLDKRLALRALTLIGTSIKRQVVIWLSLATLMSAFLPNAVVAATLCPIAASMLRFSLGEDEQGSSQSGYLVQLAIVWGAGLGGFGTPLGGAMNLIAIKFIESYTGTEYMYITWTLKMLPYLLVLFAGTCVYLLSIRTERTHLSGSRAFFQEEYQKLGQMSRSEIISLVLFVLSVLLAFARPLYEGILPELKPYFVFLILGVLAFFLPGGNGGRLVSWELASKHMNWGLILLFSGGLAAGNLILSTGAADAVAQAVQKLQLHSPQLLLILFLTLGIFLANTSSNTAAVAVLIPVVIGVASGLKLDPLPFVYAASAACNAAFALPTSIRAIPVGYGLDIRFMFKKGMAAAGISLAVLLLTALAMTVVV